MKTKIIFTLIIFAGIYGCKKNSQTPVQPQPENNVFVVNPTFYVNGVPSLEGWTVPDSNTVRFSDDIPPNGSSSSIVFNVSMGPMLGWPDNSIYTTFTVPEGRHVYRLSVVGKMKFVGGASSGEVEVNCNRPESNNSKYLTSIDILDTNWVTYSCIDTIQTVPGDSIYLTIYGGSCECTGQTFINSCDFEKID